jgi:hypothetical protein
VLAASYYSDPVPGFIAVVVVCGAAVAWVIAVAVRNFGRGGRQ